MTLTLLYSDGFDGSTLASVWNRRGVASETIASSQLQATLTAGQGYWLDPAPIVGMLSDYTVEFAVQTLVQNSGAVMIGPQLTDSSGTGICLAWYTGSPTGLLYLNTTNWTYPGGFSTAFGGTAIYPNRIRLRKAGNYWYARYSQDDGASWSAEAAAFLRAFTPTQVGFYNVAGGTTGTVTVNSFSIYADISAITSAPVFGITGGLNNGAMVTWSSSDPSIQFYEYRVDGGAWTSTTTNSATITGLTNGVASTVDVRGTNSIGPGPVATTTVTPNTDALLADDFARPDSTTVIGSPVQGGPYTIRTGQWGITSSQLYSSISTSDGHLTFPAAADVDLQMNITTPATYVALIARWVDLSNYWFFAANTSNYILLKRSSGPVNTTIATYARTPAAGDVIRLIAKGRYIYAYANGVLLGTAEDYAYASASSTAGIISSGNTTARMDNIYVTSAPAVMPGTTDGSSNVIVKTMDFGPDSSGPRIGYVYKGRDTKTADDGNA